jgi:hypothetical protein
MKRNILLIICAIISQLCCGQSQIKNKAFEQFVNKFTELKLKSFPIKCKPIPNNFFYFTDNSFHEISLDEAKKYLSYSDKDYYVTEYDYDVDEDKISNIRQVENPPFANNKILQSNYIGLIYLWSSSLYLNKSDTAIEMLNTFSIDGEYIDKIVIQGHYTRSHDWRDVIFLDSSILRIFDYKPNLENYTIKGGAYYIIDEKKPQTIVEITDYQIDENGKINLIKTYPKQYLKEFVSFYRSYHENSDDPMNEYN